MIKFSIIVPVYNGEPYLRECIESILRQEYSYFELLLIDDGSADNSLAICKSYEKIDTRIRCFHQENQGVSIARNLGLSNAEGDWITFVDADDSIEPKMLAAIHEAVTTFEKVDSVCFAYDAIERIREISLSKYREALIQAILQTPVKNSPFSGIPNLAAIWGKFFRRTLLLKNKLYFYPELVMGEDMIFNLEAGLTADHMLLIPGNFYNYRLNLNSASKGYNPLIPQKDLLFQQKLQDILISKQLEHIREEVCLRAALGGILNSCNSYFFRFPFKHYHTYYHELDSFIQKPVYANALHQIQKCAFLRKSQKFILYCIKYKMFFIVWGMKKLFKLFCKFQNRI